MSEGCLTLNPISASVLMRSDPPLPWLAQVRGGLRDKPGKPVDYYHTCYCLSGLSSAQHYSGVVVGPPENLLAAADPMCNVVQPKLDAARRFYAMQPTPGPGPQAGS